MPCPMTFTHCDMLVIHQSLPPQGVPHPIAPYAKW